MHVVEVAEAPCLVCGSGNVPRNDGTMPRFVDLERDVNWNDPAIICEDCGTKVGVLCGMLTPDHLEPYKTEIVQLKRDAHELAQDYERMERTARRYKRRADALEKVPA